ncbi:MAG TPA: hypothetical protein VNP04_15625 [Alphaproteobacteria bacterium]|nr:hypothetical protein [Alphaproteobacteria bacterium]
MSARHRILVDDPAIISRLSQHASHHHLSLKAIVAEAVRTYLPSQPQLEALLQRHEPTLSRRDLCHYALHWLCQSEAPIPVAIVPANGRQFWLYDLPLPAPEGPRILPPSLTAHL